VPGTLTVIEVDPDGDGVLLLRAARADDATQLVGQLQMMFGASDAVELRPKLIVAAANISGVAPLEKRPDLPSVLGALDEDGCRWVGIAYVDRIARDPMIAAEFLELLAGRGASLLLGQLGRVLDFSELR
jgi:hypothetical protein